MSADLPTVLKRSRYEQRWGSLKTERSTWIEHWRDLSQVLEPRSGRFFTMDRDRGFKRHNAIYDNTGTKALRVLSAGLMAGMTSPARPWFRLGTPDEELNQAHDAQVWLSGVRRIMLNVFARSNTYRMLQQVYRELGLFGTAASIQVPDFAKVIHHYPQTVGMYAVACNDKGRVDTLYREFQKPVSAVVKEYGYNNCTVGTQRLFDAGQLEAWITLRQAIEPRADRDKSKRDAKNMPYKSVTWENGAPPDLYLRESGFKYFRGICPRWDAVGEDIYGQSPAMEALGDVRQLQHQQLRKAQGIDFMTKPALQAPVSAKNDGVNIAPGAVNYVASAADAGFKSMFDVRLDLADLLADIQDVRNRINSAFYADLFLMLAQMPSDSTMTATEVAERHEEKLLMLGPVLERLHDELLDPLVSITFYDMLEAGLVPPPPQILQGQPVRVEFTSVLAQAQKAVSTGGMDRFVSALGTVAQFKPDVLDKFDSDKWVDTYADSLGVDPELIVGDKQVAMVRDARAKQQQQQEQQEQMNMAANTAATAAKVPTGSQPQNNMASDLMNQFSGYGSPSPESL